MIKFGRLAAVAAVMAGAFTFIDAFARDAAPAPGVKVAGAAQPALRGTVTEPTAEVCARKVKIVYGGMGERSRAGCPANGS